MVADVNEENAKAVAEKYGYQRWTTDWHEIMDDPAIDLVDITTPNASHCPIAIQAAKHGKHVYCEKPLAMTAQEAAEAVSYTHLDVYKRQVWRSAAGPETGDGAGAPRHGICPLLH